MRNPRECLGARTVGRKPVRFVLPLCFAFLCTGCMSGKRDLETICRAPEHVRAPAKEKVSATAVRYANYVTRHLDSASGQDLWNAVWQAKPGKKANVLRQEAKRAGLRSCPLADWYAANEAQVKVAASVRGK